MARPRASHTTGPTDEFYDCLRWYRERLTGPARLREFRWTPLLLGPSWQTADGRWLLPERTLGWEALAWCGVTLQHSPGRPWTFTDEQARLLLWWYAVDDTGRFLANDGVLQRLKGWGKDPFGACVSAIELLGPSRFAEWDADGQPLATDCPDAWVQIAAVALEQTKNTMRLFPGLFTRDARRRYGLEILKETIHGLNSERFLQAVTSSPTTLEGARATFVLLNETQHWDASNSGHDMADVIERNAAKSPDGAARTLRITNAYEPGQDSVAERDREAWEQIEAGRSAPIGLLYDSIEAAPEAPLTAEAAPEVVDSIRGDSVWLDVIRILASILDPRNPPSRSRRFWYNQITAVEDAWVAPIEWDAGAAPDLVVAARTVVTLGFDGSTTDDHCALIGCDVARDHLFELGVWEPVLDGEVDRLAIDRAVRSAFETYDVVGFYSDLHPWESYVDTWATELGEDLIVKAASRHPIAWDIRARVQQFTFAVERLHAAIVDSASTVTRGETGSARLTHCGSPKFRRHVHNARRAPNRFGISVRKDHRESARKIDAVPAAALARLARLDYLALPEAKRRRDRGGQVW